ncbi:type II toxin-antitoxin system VapC family toxin [Phyllobacterium endophyticum]|jgi:tRNA(fMet)-specific endonuclease VapC|uniref:type II toxin-antitoxin system VapC family toxin n=1 Tax=Phyllobacterium endophyticum TaxID=1149773 RepID=UPI0011C8D4B2|nr:type II toxin-antitoxin system VapC family toxin [Phyllobacterium endophyticum]TXR49755.1 type II toxin-antitoxin system VapC family toxin [Phyllobacterium endophyticum]
MSHIYMLDANIISEFVRSPHGDVARKVNDNEGPRFCTSIIVAAEIRFGVAKKKSDKLRVRIEAIFSAIDILPFDHPADHHYGRIRAELQALGTPIGANDLLIAAHACATGTILVTDNLREFSRVPGLRTENWL